MGNRLRFNLNDYVLFWPGVGVALVVAAMAATRLARAMNRPWLVAFGLTFSVGAIVAATLTPGRDALLFGIPGSGRCDLSDMGLPTIADLRTFNDTSLNVLLFVPLGLSVVLAGRSRRTVALVAASLAFPFAIEAIQLALTPLGRTCQSVDVVDNLTGLVLGIGLGILLGAASRLVARAPVSPDGPADPGV